MLVKYYLKKYFFNNLLFLFFDKFGYSHIYFSNFFYFIFLKNNQLLFDSKLILNNYFFNLKKYNFFIYFFIQFLNYFFFVNFFSKIFFTRFMFFVSVGLGFKRKRKIRKNKKYLELYIGNRHRIMCKLENFSYVFLLRRSTFYMFSNFKKPIYTVLTKFRSAKKELAFKIKGFFFFRFKMNRALARTWAFARRIRFKRIKTKLSKKQKLL